MFFLGLFLRLGYALFVFVTFFTGSLAGYGVYKSEGPYFVAIRAFLLVAAFSAAAAAFMKFLLWRLDEMK